MANDQEIGVGKPPARPEARERPEERLDSWKEIAAYLRRDVTTVQRWEKREGMPVHRHVHAKIGSVYAFRSELDGWVRNRKIEPDQESRYDGSSSEVAAPTQPRQRLIFRLRWRLVVPLAAAAAVLGTGASLWLQRAGYFWRNPIVDARYQTIASFDGQAEAAAISRDGQFVAFLSDRDGQMDVWVTQAGSGQFHNLTRGSAPELVNPAVRTLGFSPDGSQVTFWARKPSDASGRRIGIWSVPTLGGEPRPYLEDVAEYDWSRDGSRLAYHTTASGDPLFVSGGSPRAGDRALHTAPIGQHCHFPLWSPDAAFIYFVEGTLPDKLNLWRMPATGGKPEPITPQPGRVGYPVLLDLRTLLYLSSDTDGSGPWLYGMDVKRRIPHRLTFGPEMYTSLASSADGRRLAATVALPQTTLWRVRLGDPAAPASAPEKIELTAGTGSAPRFGPDYLVYASSAGTTASIWKLVNGSSAELWTSPDAKIIGAPAVSPDGEQIAFATLQHAQRLLYVMRADGSNARVVADSLDLQGDPAWSPDGKSIAAAANEDGVPHVFRVPLGGGPPTLLVREHSLDPVWAPDGRFLVYSGPDIGTVFLVKAATAEAGEHPLPPLTLTRGARHLEFLNGGGTLAMLRGEIQHKDLWLVDLQTGAERQLTRVPRDFEIRDFTVSADGREAVLERVQERSDVVLLEIPRP